MKKIKNSEYTVKDDKEKEVIFESYIPDSLEVKCPVCDKPFINSTCKDCDELVASLQIIINLYMLYFIPHL